MKKGNSTIHLAISFDEHYVVPFYVLLTSVFLNNKQNKIILHVIAKGVTNKQISDIKQYVEKNNAVINFYNVGNELINGMEVPDGSWITTTTYYRLYFPDIVPADVEKLIYVDTDTIVIKNLAEFYEEDTGIKPLGAVRELLGEVRPEINIYDKENYFNAGVIIINVPEWKKQRITEKTADFIRNFPGKLKCVDQDALNVILKDNWYEIKRKYNVMFQDIPRKLQKENYKSFLSDKVIIHYSVGEHKPWNGLNENKFRHLYYYYLKKSPCSKEKKYVDFKYNPSYVFSFIKIRARETFSSYYKIVPSLKNAASSVFFFKKKN